MILLNVQEDTYVNSRLLRSEGTYLIAYKYETVDGVTYELWQDANGNEIRVEPTLERTTARLFGKTY